MTWHETLQIGLGELGLQPWEFYRHSLEEFEAKLEGFREAKKEQWYQTRAVCYHIAKYAGMVSKSPKQTQEQFWPLFGEKVKGSKLSSITDTAERRKAAMALRQRLIDAEWIKNN